MKTVNVMKMLELNVELPFTANRNNPVKSVTEMMFVSMVTDGTEIIVCTFRTFPSKKQIMVKMICAPSPVTRLSRSGNE